jgi:hypothetical protein
MDLEASDTKTCRFQDEKELWAQQFKASDARAAKYHAEHHGMGAR